MPTQADIQRFLGSQICVKIVSNETLLGQISGILERIGCNLIISNQNQQDYQFFAIDLSKLTIHDDYWVVDFGYNPTNKTEN